MAHISVVVPVFREEAVLHELCSQIRTALSQVADDFEIILVEDGGGDQTWDIIRQLSAEDRRIKGIKFSRNFGQHYAITAGLDACDGDWVVVMDGDLQDRPEVIPELYAKAQEGYDVVFVARQKRPEGLIYQFAQRSFYKTFQYLSGTDYDPAHGNFSIISRKVLEHFRGFRESLRFYGAIINWLGFKWVSLPARHGERYAGTSSYTPAKLLRLAGDVILAHSNRPLHFSIALGLFMSGVSFLAGCYILTLALFTDFSVEGWASLIVSIYFTGGVILVVLGIIGIYIGKIFTELKGRPLYIVADRVGFLNSQDGANANAR